MGEINDMKVLVVSPHPDDETLGAGGTIMRLISEGHKVYWLNMTCIKPNQKCFSKEMIEKREIQLKEISEYYFFSKIYHLNLPTTELDNCNANDVIGRITEIMHEVRPQLLILPDYNDAHSDHKKTFEWCYVCSKNFRFPFIKQIMTMEILSETDFGRPEAPFTPNYFVDISDFMEKKIKAMQIYDTELGNPPFPRSLENIKALATTRGATAGVRYAEAFRLVKYVV